MKRPTTTLFLLMSLDGKISTGSTDNMDFDKDFPKISGLKEGLHQYYAIEQTTDLWSFNTGRVQAKIGVNERKNPEKTPVSFVILDNHHLQKSGIKYFCQLSDKFVLITSNKNHPAFQMKADNMHIIFSENLSLSNVLEELYEKHNCKRLTIQSGGTLNSLFLKEKLIDYVDIVVAPVLIGGKNTPTAVDGQSIVKEDELKDIGILQLEKCIPLENSYIRLRYKVIH